MRSCRGAREAGVRGIKPRKCFPANPGLFSGSPERPAACLSGSGQETAFSCSGPARPCRTAEGGGARTRAAYPGEGARRLPGEPLCRPGCSSPSLDLNFPRGEPSSQQGIPRPPSHPGGSSPKVKPSTSFATFRCSNSGPSDYRASRHRAQRERLDRYPHQAPLALPRKFAESSVRVPLAHRFQMNRPYRAFVPSSQSASSPPPRFTQWNALRFSVSTACVSSPRPPRRCRGDTRWKAVPGSGIDAGFRKIDGENRPELVSRRDPVQWTVGISPSGPRHSPSPQAGTPSSLQPPAVIRTFLLKAPALRRGQYVGIPGKIRARGCKLPGRAKHDRRYSPLRVPVIENRCTGCDLPERTGRGSTEPSHAKRKRSACFGLRWSARTGAGAGCSRAHRWAQGSSLLLPSPPQEHQEILLHHLFCSLDGHPGV